MYQRILLAALAVVVVATFAISQRAEALANPLSTVRTFNVTCATTATPIIAPDGKTNIASWSAWNNSATIVYIGGSDVTAGTTKGWPICTASANCPSSTLSADSSAVAYCRVASGTVTLVVVSGNQ